MTIEVKFHVGDSIEKAFQEATMFASKNNVVIEFSFNGVRCRAFPFGDVDTGVKNYEEAIDKNYSYADNK